MQLTRRQWLATAAIGAGIVGTRARGWGEEVAAAKPPKWQIGCFNRPWSRWTFDEALDGMRDAGFRTIGLLGDHAGEPFVLPQATDEYLAKLKQRIESRGLRPIVTWLRTPHDVGIAESVERAKAQIDHARRLGISYLLTTGVDPPAQADHYTRVMIEAAKYAEERQMQIALKPHGGIAATADDLSRLVERVDRPNFRVWYDPGNIIHYTGRDPVAEARRVAPLVSGLCAKDCTMRGGDVMIAFGAGKVEFAGVLATLSQAGFQGPIMVECCAGNTVAEVTAGARANREYLQQVIDRL